MNKIATYLNEHLLGEVAGSKAMRKRYSRDGSVLSITPEIIVFPRVTNDIRKVARFTWQLAEKGHPMGITMRGLGSDTTGGAIGKGIVISTPQYLKSIIDIATKDKLVHVQPGATFDATLSALQWQGLTLLGVNEEGPNGTIGGAIAGNTLGSGENGIADSIKRLEVILANGDILETGRISRQNLSKKLGLQTFEGEIYRKLEGLIEDNSELIQQLADDPVRDNAGFSGIGRVKAKDGSFDLTPLFIGTQGTLGIISEAVLNAEFYSQDHTKAVITTADSGVANDIVDKIYELNPSALQVINGDLLRNADKQGIKFGLLGGVDDISSVIYIDFNDFNRRTQQGKLKKLRKIVKKMNIGMVDSSDHSIEEFNPIAALADTLGRIAPDDESPLPILDGFFVPASRFAEFEGGFAELAQKHHLELPTIMNVLSGTINVYPALKLDVVSDKQKIFKLMNDLAALVQRSGGAFVSNGAEGRLKANAAWSVLAEADITLFEQVRAIFDPFGTLNPDVKQKNDLRHVVSSLRSSYDVTDLVA